MPTPPTRTRAGFLLAGLVLAIVLIVGFALYSAFGGGSDDDDATAVAEEPAGTRLEMAHEAAGWPGKQYVEVRDGGYTLIIDGDGDEQAGASIGTIVAVLHALDVPDAVVAQMDSTRALDGRQDASWDEFTASWTYHPDNGLDIIIQQDLP